MYAPCRLLFDRLMDVTREDQSTRAVKALSVLVECASRDLCVHRVSCTDDLNAAYRDLGLTPPL